MAEFVLQNEVLVRLKRTDETGGSAGDMENNAAGLFGVGCGGDQGGIDGHAHACPVSFQRSGEEGFPFSFGWFRRRKFSIQGLCGLSKERKQQGGENCQRESAERGHVTVIMRFPALRQHRCQYCFTAPA
jgi:hypothetical protein